MKNGALETVKTFIICVRGCKNDVFGSIRFPVILGTILEVILELKMNPKAHLDSLLPPSLAILCAIR